MLLVEFYYNKFARVLHLFFQGCRTVSVIFAKTGTKRGENGTDALTNRRNTRKSIPLCAVKTLLAAAKALGNNTTPSYFSVDSNCQFMLKYDCIE